MLDVLRFWCDARRRRLPHRRAAPDRSRTTAGATTRPTRPGATATTRTTRSSPSTRPTGPRCWSWCALMREAVGPERVLIGELYLPLERLVRYYGAGLDLPANFHLLTTPWEAEARRRADRAPTRRRCRTARGRTGCSATTTGRGWRAGSAPAQARVAADAAAHAARHADALLRRRARHARRPDRARARAGPVGAAVPGRARARPGAHPDAVGRRAERRVLPARGRAVAAAGPRRRPASRSQARARPRCSRSTGACWRCAAPSRRSRTATGAGSARRTACWPTGAAIRSSSRST